MSALIQDVGAPDLQIHPLFQDGSMIGHPRVLVSGDLALLIGLVAIPDQGLRPSVPCGGQQSDRPHQNIHRAVAALSLRESD